MENIDQVIFYKLERAIKSYRQFAQRRIRDAGYAITIDQWLTIECILENPGIKQMDLASKVFKDGASITRIIELMVGAGYLVRSVNKGDRRRANLSVTKEGEEIAFNVSSVVFHNREIALRGIDRDEMQIVDRFLKAVTDNCQQKPAKKMEVDIFGSAIDQKIVPKVETIASNTEVDTRPKVKRQN